MVGYDDSEVLSTYAFKAVDNAYGCNVVAKEDFSGYNAKVVVRLVCGTHSAKLFDSATFPWVGSLTNVWTILKSEVFTLVSKDVAMVMIFEPVMTPAHAIAPTERVASIVVLPVISHVPFTWSLDVGVFIPIPTAPVLVITICCTASVENERESAELE